MEGELVAKVRHKHLDCFNRTTDRHSTASSLSICYSLLLNSDEQRVVGCESWQVNPAKHFNRASLDQTNCVPFSICRPASGLLVGLLLFVRLAPAKARNRMSFSSLLNSLWLSSRAARFCGTLSGSSKAQTKRGELKTERLSTKRKRTTQTPFSFSYPQSAHSTTTANLIAREQRDNQIISFYLQFALLLQSPSRSLSLSPSNSLGFLCYPNSK